MHRYVHWLAPLIATGVALYIALFMFQVNRTDPAPAVEPVSRERDKSVETPRIARGWLDALAVNEEEGYFYPVNEIYIQLDLNQKFVHEKTYRLLAKLQNPYQLFCLKQELKHHRLRYAFKREGDGAQLVIYSEKREELEALVKTLKNYQITASFLPNEEEQRWKNTK